MLGNGPVFTEVDGRSPTPGEWWNALAVSLSAMTAVALLSALRFGVVPYPSAVYAAWDQNRYIAMALHPFSANPLVHQAPFAWRILTPLLAHVLPLPFKDSFYAINFVALALVGPFVYGWLRSAGRPHSSAAAATLGFYGLYWGPWFVSWDYFLTDGIGLLVTAIGLWLLLRRGVRWWVFSLVVAAGSLNKESALFLLLPYFLIAVRRGAVLKTAWSTIKVALLPCAVTSALRAWIYHTNTYDYLALLRRARGLPGVHAALGPRLAVAIVHVGWTYSFATFGLLLLPVTAVAALRLARILTRREVSRAWGRRAGVLSAIGVSAPACLAAVVVSNPTRAVAYAFPIVLLLFSLSVEVLASALGWSRRVASGVAGAVIGAQIAAILAGFDTTPGASVIVVVGIVAGVATVYAWALRTRRAEESQP